jgi:hypothetical protein
MSGREKAIAEAKIFGYRHAFTRHMVRDHGIEDLRDHVLSEIASAMPEAIEKEFHGSVTVEDDDDTGGVVIRGELAIMPAEDYYRLKERAAGRK